MERKLEQLITIYRTQLDCYKRQKINIESTTSKDRWNDKKLIEIASRIKFPKAIFGLRNYKSIIIHFFNFYFTGKIAPCYTVQSIVFSAISLLNISAKNGSYKRVFDEEDYMERGNIKPFFKWTIDSDSDSPFLEVLRGINDRFKMEIQAILDSWDASRTWNDENQAKLTRLTAFLALTLCRIVGYNEIQLGIYFRSKEYRQILTDFVGWKVDQPFQSASLESLKKCKEQLNNEFFLTKRIFAVVVQHWMFAEKLDWEAEEEEMESMKVLLYESLLESMEGHGMTIIKLLLSICKTTGSSYREIKDMINVVGCNFTTSVYWQEVKQFYKRYLKKNHQTSVMWAKLVDEEYFSEYSVKLTEKDWALLITILELKEKSEDWHDSWIKERPKIISRAKELAKVTHRKLMEAEIEDDNTREKDAVEYLRNRSVIKSSKANWNDEKLEEFASKQKFPREVFDSRNVKSILTRFFYFYLTGKLNRSSSIQSTVFSPISLLNIPDIRGFKRVFGEAYMERRDAKPFYTWDKITETDSLSSIDSSDNRFINHIQIVLGSWNERKIWIFGKQAQLMRLAAFLALTICRVIAVDENLLLNSFRTRDYRRSLADCVGWPMALPYMSPSEECLRRSRNDFTRSFNTPLSPIFAIAVRHWIMTQKLHPDDHATRALLYYALLESTKGYGMGLITMLLGCLEYTGQSFENLMDVIISVTPKLKTFNGWESLQEFHRDVLSKTDVKQYSFHWARTIDQNYYAECSSKFSTLLCAIFGGILEFKQGRSIWKAQWAQEKLDITSIGKEIGQKIHQILMVRDVAGKVGTTRN